MSLEVWCFFEDANQEPEIRMFSDLYWAQLKKDFESWVLSLG